MSDAIDMEPDTIEEFPDINPLDSVEEVLTSHNWVFNRRNSDELVVEVAGRCCSYRLFFMWQEEMNAMQFCCQYNLTIPRENYSVAATTLMNLNENLWMGHYDLSTKSGTPGFRQTCLLRGTEGAYEQMEDLVDMSLLLCERHYPVFHLLTTEYGANEENMVLALMDAAGES